MSYYTDYTVSAEGDFTFTDEIVEKYFSYSGLDVHRYDNAMWGNTKWYSSSKDMRELSADFPDILFVVEGNGEDDTDLWKAYYKSGKQQFVKAIITYDEFDETKLK